LGCEFTLDTLPARKAVVSLRAPNLSATSILVEHGEYGWWHALVNADTPIINIGDYEFVSEDLARLRTWLAGFEAEHADWHMP
jgi:hypothetical protein